MGDAERFANNSAPSDGPKIAGDQLPTRNGGTRVWRFVLVFAVLLPGAGIPAYRFQRARVVASCLEVCERARETGDWKQLAQVSSRWLWWESGSGQAMVLRALAHERQDELEEAAVLLARISDEDEWCISALTVHIDLLLFRLNRPTQAEQTCRRLLKLDPAMGRAHQRLIDIYAATFQRGPLERQIRDAIAHTCEPPESWTYLLVADHGIDFSDGLASCTRWRLEEPENEILIVAQAIYADIRRRKAADGNPVKENRLLEQASEKFPQNLELLNHRIRNAVFDGEIDQAAALLREAPEAARLDARFWRYKAQLHESQKQYEQAREAIQEAETLDPVSWRTQNLLAITLRATGQVAGVKRASHRAATGREIERQLLALQNGKMWVQTDVGPQMQMYLAECGADDLAEALARRLR